MKKIIILSGLALLFGFNTIMAQDTIYIYLRGMRIIEVPVADIDSFIFYKAITPTGTVVDIDGNIYNTKLFGTQEWMIENLKVTKYRNGESIPTTTPFNLDISTVDQPKYQWAYNGNDGHVLTYGRLYTWYAVNDSRGVCPSGWHFPTDAEWKKLEMFLGMSQSEADLSMAYRGTYEGSKMAGHATLWKDGDLDLNVYFGLSGFNVMPGGFHDQTGSFENLGEICIFWTATTTSTSSWAFYRKLVYSNTAIYRYYSNKKNACYIRCVKD